VLERTARRWKVLAGVLAAGLIGVGVMAAGPERENLDVGSITAKSITVLDPNGGRIEIGATADDASITVKSPGSNAFVRLAAVRGEGAFPSHASIEANAHPVGKVIGGSAEIEANEKNGRLLIFKGGSRQDLIFEQPPAKP
jgi:hypothetical protein